MHPFAPRHVAFHGLRRFGDWQLKVYSIRLAPDAMSWTAIAVDFAPGIALAEASLPTPAVASDRPGAGFLILHRGRTTNYTVLGWWDRENELPLRVFVSPDRRPQSWRCAEGSESICVWDLEVLWREREAYVATVLGARPGDVADYLALIVPGAVSDV